MLFEIPFLKRFAAKFLQQESRKTLVKGAVSALIVRGFGAGIMFGTQVLLARLLGSTEYGHFVYAVSWLAILAMIAKFGFDNALPRFIPEYKVNGNLESLRGLLKYSVRFVGGLGLLVGALFSLLLFFTPLFDTSQQPALLIMLIALPFYAMTHIRQASLRALKHIVLSELPEGIIRPVSLCLLAVLTYFMLDAFLAWHVWLCHLVAILVALSAGTFWYFQRIAKENHHGPTVYETRTWRRVSFPMLLIESMNVLMNNFSIILVGFFVLPRDVALLGVVSRIMILVTFAQMAVNTIAAPMISELFYSKKMGELQDVLKLAAKGIFIFTIVVDVFLIIFGKFILGLFGPDYIAGYVFLLVLLGATTIKALAGSATYVLNMTGHHALTTKLMAGNLLISIMLNVALIPSFGVWGAVVAGAVTVSMWNIILVYFSIKTVKINTTVFKIFNVY